ncbi:MAG: hypothetical protein F7C34_00575 [Desulfurococcales archaeon]|nr:hypothetical protein [Desulfurococcales archaeon]
MKRLYPLIVVLLLTAVQALSVSASSSDEVAGQMPIRVVSVRCEPLKNKTLINVLVRLPNPGYNLEKRNVSVQNGTATIELWFSPPQGPVIQIIKDAGVVVTVNATVERVRVLINGTEAYQGPCGQGQGEDTGTTSQPTSPESASQESGATRAQGGGRELRLGVLGAGIAGALIAVLLLGSRRR